MKQKCGGRIENLVVFVSELVSDDAMEIRESIIRNHRNVEKDQWPKYVECFSKEEIWKLIKFKFDSEETIQKVKHLKGCKSCFDKVNKELKKEKKQKKVKTV